VIVGRRGVITEHLLSGSRHRVATRACRVSFTRLHRRVLLSLCFCLLCCRPSPVCGPASVTSPITSVRYCPPCCRLHITCWGTRPGKLDSVPVFLMFAIVIPSDLQGAWQTHTCSSISSLAIPASASRACCYNLPISAFSLSMISR